MKFFSFAGEYVKNYMRHMVREDGTKKTGKTEPMQNNRIALNAGDHHCVNNIGKPGGGTGLTP